MKSWLFRYFAVIVGVASGQAWGEAPDPLECPIALLEPSSTSFNEDRVRAMEPMCLRNAAYYRFIGAHRLAQGQAHKAQDAIERALLLDPDDIHTQWLYAQALNQVGEQISAILLLQSLLSAPGLPEHLAQAIQAALQPLIQPAAAWAYRTGFAISAVADSNLNNAALSSELTLTLPQGNVTLPLDPALRRQSGAAGMVQLHWAAAHQRRQQLWLLQADIRHRHTPSAAQNQTQADFAATWLQAPEASRQWSGRLQQSHVQWAGDSLYSASRLGVQHQWRLSGAWAGLSNCRVAAGAETEWRRYPAATSLDGQYVGGTFSLGCRDESTQQHWQLNWRTGQDTPRQASRVGGSYQQSDWRFAWSAPWAAGRMTLDYHHAQQSDATGYSPLLANNARRTQSRHAVGLEYSQPLWMASGWQWYAGLEYTRQRSNLALFSADRHALSLGLRWGALAQ